MGRRDGKEIKNNKRRLLLLGWSPSQVSEPDVRSCLDTVRGSWGFVLNHVL